MSRRAAFLLLILSALGTAPAGADALQYYEGRAPFRGMDPLDFWAGQPVRIADRPATPVRRSPRLESRRPLYGSAVLGTSGRATLLLLDESGGTGEGYDTVYVDANLNGDFTDDVVPMRKLRSLRGYATAQPLWLRVPLPGRTALCRASIEKHTIPPFLTSGSPQAPRTGPSGGREWYHLKPEGYRLGRVRFGRRVIQVAVVDANCNGIFGDLDRRSLIGDRLVLDLNGNGIFDGPRFDQLGYSAGAEVVIPGRHIAVDGRCYSLRIAPDGSDVRATPVVGGLGRVRLDLQDAYLALAGRESLLFLDVDGREARIPEGRYQLMVWAVSQRDRRGRIWQVTGGRWGPIEDRREVVVARGRTTSLRLAGTPWRSHLTARPAGSGTPRRGTLAFDILLESGTGHMISEMRLVGPGFQWDPVFCWPRPPLRPDGRPFRRPNTHPFAIPTITITDPNGTQVSGLACRSRAAGYLWSGDWRVPARLRGRKLKAIAHFDGWPFGVKQASCAFTAR